MLHLPDDGTGPLKPLKWYRDLATRKGRLDAKAFLVEGPRAVRQITSNNPHELIEIVYTGELPPNYGHYASRQVTEKQLDSISSTKTPQEIIAVVHLPLKTYSDQLPDSPGAKVLLLEDVQDPGNVGTLIRTAVAFGFSGIILTDKCADPLSPKCIQATAGTVLSLWIRRTTRCLDLVKELKNNRYVLVSTNLNGTEDFSVLRHRNNLILALGNEAAGLSRSILQESDYRLRIPIVTDRAESLNVAACGAICMYLSCHY